MTNVKKGDMAQVIRATPSYQWTLGRVVKIAQGCCFSDVMPAWKFEEPLRHGAVSVQCAPDSHLKRIEPLSDDDARRETLEMAVCDPDTRYIPLTALEQMR